jgi:hypothetical protein
MTGNQQQGYGNPYQQRQPRARAAVSRGAGRQAVAQPSYSNQRSASSASRGSKRQKSEIYWDGRDSSEGDSGQSSIGVPAPPSTRALRQARTTPSTSAVQKPRQSRRNVVRQSENAPSPPERQNMKWGKEEKPDTKRAMQWGKQERPSIVGSEPGSSQGSSVATQSASSSQVQSQSQASGRKFQWGKTQ